MPSWTRIALIAFALILIAGCGEEEECPSNVMTTLSAPALGVDFQMDRYEASRFDATNSDQGSGSEKACSVPNVQPWVDVSYGKASSACKAAGKRLCTREEYNIACRSLGLDWDYPYGQSYDATQCNGENSNPGALPTGASTTCKTQVPPQEEIFDLVGNVSEWVSSETGLAGGSYSSGALDLSCDNILVPSTGEDTKGAGIGFRCCR